MAKDKKKVTREQIIKKPGVLASKIVHNLLYENNFNLYFIGNTAGNSLYTVVLNNNERVLVSFTDENILESYVNREVISNILKKTFGDNIVCVKINLYSLYRLLHNNDYDSVDDEILHPNQDVNTTIINPNNRDFFIPIHIKSVCDYLLKEKIFDKNNNEEYIDEDNLKHLSYNKKIKRYSFQENDII